MSNPDPLIVNAYFLDFTIHELLKQRNAGRFDRRNPLKDYGGWVYLETTYGSRTLRVSLRPWKLKKKGRVNQGQAVQSDIELTTGASHDFHVAVPGWRLQGLLKLMGNERIKIWGDMMKLTIRSLDDHARFTFWNQST